MTSPNHSTQATPQPVIKFRYANLSPVWGAADAGTRSRCSHKSPEETIASVALGDQSDRCGDRIATELFYYDPAQLRG